MKEMASCLQCKLTGTERSENLWEKASSNYHLQPNCFYGNWENWETSLSRSHNSNKSLISKFSEYTHLKTQEPVLHLIKDKSYEILPVKTAVGNDSTHRKNKNVMLFSAGENMSFSTAVYSECVQ